GEAADGSDSYAEPLLAPRDWPLQVVIAITGKDEKDVGSTRGMQLSAASSPYYGAGGNEPGRSRARPRGDRGQGLREARRCIRAQLPEDACSRHGCTSPADLLAPGDARLSRNHPRLTQRRSSSVLHHRCRSASQGGLRAAGAAAGGGGARAGTRRSRGADQRSRPWRRARIGPRRSALGRRESWWRWESTLSSRAPP